MIVCATASLLKEIIAINICRLVAANHLLSPSLSLCKRNSLVLSRIAEERRDGSSPLLADTIGAVPDEAHRVDNSDESGAQGKEEEQQMAHFSRRGWGY